jgi:hypothetical protein
MPIVDVVRTYPKQVLQAMGMRIAENGAFYVFSIFVLTYVTTQLGLESSTAQTGVLIAAGIGLVSLPFLVGSPTVSDGGQCTSSVRCSRCCSPSPSSGS